MPCTAQDIINEARKYVGVTGSPKGSHNVPFNTWYYGYQVNDTKAYFWCVVFISYIFAAIGAAMLFCDGNKANRCKTVREWATAAGLTVDKTTIRPGDLVLFDWEPNNSPDHIALATGAISNGKFTTIEGNVEDSVKEMTRSLDKVALVVRPKYKSSGAACSPETCPILAWLRSQIK